MPTGGGTSVRLTPDTPQYESYGGFDWSPDGARIVYAREQNAPLGSGETLDLYVVQLGTGASTRLTNTKYTTGFAPAEEGPVFSPDGTRIAYHRQGDIWVMAADGSGQAPLTATAWSETWPSWQPCVAATRRCVLEPKPPTQQPPPGEPPPPDQPPPPAATTPAPARCVVPKLRGLSLTKAKRALTRRTCRLGRVTRSFTRVRKGWIVSQSPRAGRILARGAKVHVVVSRGKRP
jgi:hypothetical protein